MPVSLLIGTLAFGAEEKKGPAPPSQAPAGAKAEKAKAKDSRGPAVRRPLLEARQGFETKVVDRPVERDPPPEPPAGELTLTRYRSPVGELAAYVTPDPGDGKKRPAIIWVCGGHSNSLWDVWAPVDRKDDQSAGGFREARIITMYPALRGGNGGGTGRYEAFYGEVDDVLAARDHLAALTYVDSDRIYLGGHSTGGTLALLVSAATDRFRGVFSFGPVSRVDAYGPDFLPFDMSNPKEIELRSPIYWVSSMACPTFVFEGTGGNIKDLNAMKIASRNKLVQFHAIEDADHFNILYGVTRLVAKKINADKAKTSRISFTPGELKGAAREYLAK